MVCVPPHRTGQPKEQNGGDALEGPAVSYNRSRYANEYSGSVFLLFMLEDVLREEMNEAKQAELFRIR